MKRLALTGLIAAAASAFAASAAQAQAEPCADFAARAQVSDLRLQSAEALAAGQAWQQRNGQPGTPVNAAMCRVRGVIEAEIAFELWLPAAPAWGGRLLVAGVGGEAGTFNYADMARGVQRGYASASTDTGHRDDEPDWAVGRPDRRANFAARANHLLAVKSKLLLKQFYGEAARKAYFIGCSGGGREGLKEVQAYPDDFDGVLAGGAGPDQLAVSTRLFWSQYVRGPDWARAMGPAHWRLVADAGVRACDAQDGVADGVVTHPPACRFDPAALLCKPDSDPSACLSPAQLAVVHEAYAPLRDDAGEHIDDGLLPGVRVTQSPRSAFAHTLFAKVVHGDPDWDVSRFNLRRDKAAARLAWPDLPNDQADLSAFKARGGKLIYYHGWLDPWILAQGPVAYHQAVGRVVPGVQDFFRLFMVPGMGHCRGGAGTDQFGGAGADAPAVDADHDLLAALQAWVEQGRAPQRIVAARVEQGRITRTRPLCPHPQQAAYMGSGSTDDARHFICRTSESPP